MAPPSTPHAATPSRRCSWRRVPGALVALALGTVLAELTYRAALFSDFAWLEPLRDARKHADYFSEDVYWLLDRRFGSEFPPPRRPHTVLGWVGDFDRETYRHRREDELGGRRPVLLYGDSFAACVPESRCFQDFLQADEGFARGHFLLNYGVAGYGVGQIRLLLERTIDLYEDPFVVVGVMTYDLDRTVLSVRTGQKPRFALRNGELVLVGPPIEPNSTDFYAAHPPRIVSYLYRRAVYSPSFPAPLAGWLRRDAAHTREKREVNGALLRVIAADLRARDLDFVFLVFHAVLEARGDWRESFLEELFAEEELPWIGSRAIVLASAPDGASRPRDFFLPDGHPTSLYNRLVAEALRARILGNTR